MECEFLSNLKSSSYNLKSFSSSFNLYIPSEYLLKLPKSISVKDSISIILVEFLSST